MSDFVLPPSKLKSFITQRFLNAGLPVAAIRDVLSHLEQKNNESSEISSLDRAKNYWAKLLPQEGLIERKQHPNCKVAILIPVYNERPERILRQLKYLSQQKGIEPEEFEVIYLINNSPKIMEKDQQALRNNESVLRELQYQTSLIPNVFVIDNCSSGKEIPHCNVGKARNKLMAEGSFRFFQNQKNGLLICSDADTFMEDEFYLKKIMRIFDEEADIIGAAGGIIYEFNPDDDNAPNIVELEKKAKKIMLLRKWKAFTELLSNSDFYRNKWYKSFFSGCHMISRSLESAAIGGIWEGNVFEDNVFGFEIAAYAFQHHKRITELTDQVFVVTSLRESNRTAASLYNEFINTDTGTQIYLQNPFTASKSYIVVNDENYNRLVTHVINTYPAEGRELDQHIRLTTGRL